MKGEVQKFENFPMNPKFKENLLGFQEKLEKDPALSFIELLYKEFPQAEVYLVGGSVRDVALGRPDSKDYDLIVRRVKAKDLEKFLAKRGKVNLVGKSFGVFKFIPQGLKLKHAIDIALPRTEHAWGTGGFRDVDTQSSPELPVKEDLARRDFTINAIAWDFHQKTFVDTFDGVEDLEKKEIKAVRSPQERFKEDYSRMLRALRFACQLNFSIEKNTWRALQEKIPHINDKTPERERIIPYEVIGREFLKAFKNDPVKALDLYDQSGALKELVPELLKMKGCPQPPNWHSEGDVWVHTHLALEKLSSPEFKKEFLDIKPSIELILAVLLHDIAKPLTIRTPEKDGTERIRFDEHTNIGAGLAKKICKRLRFSAAEDFKVDPERVEWLVKNHLLLLQGEVNQMRPSTIEKYFFNDKYSGQDLMMLSFVDALATIPESGAPDITNFYQAKTRIAELEKLVKEKRKLPKPILNGKEIMKKFKLPEGRQIGQLKEALREEQLSERIKDKKAAYKFLAKKILTK
jgi:poly(A) polymerase